MPFRISDLTFGDGTVIDTSDAEIVIIVGPNNSGKSSLLRELQIGIISPEPTSVALEDFTVTRLMSGESLREWFEENRATRTLGSGEQFFVTGVAKQQPVQSVAPLWDQTEGNYLGQIAGHLLLTLDTQQRLNAAASPPQIEHDQEPDDVVQVLVNSPEFLESFRDALREAFGLNLIVDRTGTSIHLRLSATESQDDFKHETNDGSSNELIVKRMRAIPSLNAQGDGVRSFAAIVLNILTARFPVVMIDEPEAFLHPPQARLLGRKLGQLQQDGQLFVATHSLDVLLGLVESNPRNVIILRLTRDGANSDVNVLMPGEVARIGTSPQMKFSRILDGLFHDGVVVCEGFSDSAFYSAVAEHVQAADIAAPAPDLMFTFAGTKDSVPSVAKSLNDLGVPVRVIVDFDSLSTVQLATALVESVGGEYTEALSLDHGLILASLDGATSPPTASEALTLIESVLGDDPDRVVTQRDTDEIRRSLGGINDWTKAKKHGRAVANEDTPLFEAIGRLLDNLARVGVFVVPKGEAESFVPHVAGRSSRWVSNVISGDHIRDASSAQQFVSRIVRSFDPGA